MTKFTHAQLAKMGRCSRAAVTQALNGSGNLAESTRERLISLAELPGKIEERFRDPMLEKMLEIGFDRLPKKTKRYEDIRSWIANVKALHVYLRDGNGKNLNAFDIVCREDDPLSVVSNKDFHTICSVAYQHTSNRKLALYITDLIRFIKLIEKK